MMLGSPEKRRFQVVAENDFVFGANAVVGPRRRGAGGARHPGDAAGQRRRTVRRLATLRRRRPGPQQAGVPP